MSALANSINALIDASRDRVPLLLTSGRTPLTEDGPHGARSVYIHWAQEMFDQAGMLREFVKWDYELRRGDQVGEVVDRALELAQTSPTGPVYLACRARCWARSCEARADAAARRAPGRAAARRAPATSNAAGGMDRRRTHPLIITGSARPRSARGSAADAPGRAFRAARGAVQPAPFRAVRPSSDVPGRAPGSLLAKADLILVLESRRALDPGPVARPRTRGSCRSARTRCTSAIRCAASAPT